MTGGNARETALQVLMSIRTSSAWADAALKAQLAQGALSGPDAALATRLVYGVLQNRLLLDFWIGAYCTQKPEHLQLPLPDILRLGVYQIVFLDRIPDSAAVNESVNLAKQHGRAKASGLVNAVLRKIVQNKNALPKVPETDVLRYLSVTYSHPKWLVKRLLALLGREETEAFLKADNGVVPMTIQVNPLKGNADALTAELTAAGVTVTPHAWVPDCLELSGTGDLTALPAFREGRFLVQDAAARLVQNAAMAQSGSRVIDVCAAPGGKSFGAAMAMGDRGSILSCDVHPNKLKRIQEGAARLGIACIETATADGRERHEEWVESADLVLVDAPCSGIGIIRKKPDIRYKSAEQLFTLSVVQTAILENAAAYVKRGGALVYSTCTVLPEENEQITDAFLAQHLDFVREAFTLPEPVGTVDGQITLWPQRNGVDGFYLCRMRRT
jgi:16S rRNA (cytosine967-C5)-methyltransferase